LTDSVQGVRQKEFRPLCHTPDSAVSNQPALSWRRAWNPGYGPCRNWWNRPRESGRGAGGEIDVSGFNLNWITFAFYGAGVAYCFYIIIFRWAAYRERYGRNSLYQHMGLVTFGFGIVGWLLAVAIWLIQRQLSN
jgi:hypothetical protein